MLLSHSTKECLYDLFFCYFCCSCCFTETDRAKRRVLTNLPYTMVVNCNTVPFEFGWVVAAWRADSAHTHV